MTRPAPLRSDHAARRERPQQRGHGYIAACLSLASGCSGSCRVADHPPRSARDRLAAGAATHERQASRATRQAIPQQPCGVPKAQTARQECFGVALTHGRGMFVKARNQIHACSVTRACATRLRSSGNPSPSAQQCFAFQGKLHTTSVSWTAVCINPGAAAGTKNGELARRIASRRSPFVLSKAPCCCRIPEAASGRRHPRTVRCWTRMRSNERRTTCSCTPQRPGTHSEAWFESSFGRAVRTSPR